MIIKYEIHGWRANRYYLLMETKSKEKAMNFTKKSYYTNRYKPIRVVELRTEEIVIYHAND